MDRIVPVWAQSVLVLLLNAPALFIVHPDPVSMLDGKRTCGVAEQHVFCLVEWLREQMFSLGVIRLYIPRLDFDVRDFSGHDHAPFGARNREPGCGCPVLLPPTAAETWMPGRNQLSSLTIYMSLGQNVSDPIVTSIWKERDWHQVWRREIHLRQWYGGLSPNWRRADLPSVLPVGWRNVACWYARLPCKICVRIFIPVSHGHALRVLEGRLQSVNCNGRKLHAQ